jgi:hypothetical protein
MNPEFSEFPKMARLSRECIITEKIDGTNAQIYITEDGRFLTGSRNRWIYPDSDNFGFSAWAHAHKDELMKLGPGRHFGEWWGSGIQRNYGLTNGERRFSLFNVQRWCLHNQEPEPIKTNDPRFYLMKYQEKLPECVGLVPVLYRGEFSTGFCGIELDRLRINGSQAAPGFMNPEGIICFHTAANVGFKKTIENDEVPKSIVRK